MAITFYLFNTRFWYIKTPTQNNTVAVISLSSTTSHFWEEIDRRFRFFR